MRRPFLYRDHENHSRGDRPDVSQYGNRNLRALRSTGLDSGETESEIKMKPFFSVITPSLQRESLVRCCQSVDEQTFENWQHIVGIDAEQQDRKLIDKTERTEKRIFVSWMRKFGNWGNTPRHMAWEHATGDYLLYLDDDNEIFRPDALADIAAALQSDGYPDFALFP